MAGISTKSSSKVPASKANVLHLEICDNRPANAAPLVPVPATMKSYIPCTK